MCQLNVYMIDKYVPGVDVKEIFKHHHHHTFENINETVVIKNYDDDYNYYEASNNKCDCGSIIGFLTNNNSKYTSYLEYLEKMKSVKWLNYTRSKSYYRPTTMRKD